MSESVTLSASVYLRPTRIGFLVRPDDMAAVRNAMQVCACLWGGMFNPIIPVGTALPEAWRETHFHEMSGSDLACGYIRFFEPDVFVEVQDGLAAEAGISATEIGIGEPRTIPIGVHADSNPDRAPRPFGTNVSHIYQDLYERDFRFVSRDGDRVASIDTAGADGAFIEAVFGGFPTTGKLGAVIFPATETCDYSDATVISPIGRRNRLCRRRADGEIKNRSAVLRNRCVDVQGEEMTCLSTLSMVSSHNYLWAPNTGSPRPPS